MTNNKIRRNYHTDLSDSSGHSECSRIEDHGVSPLAGPIRPSIRVSRLFIPVLLLGTLGTIAQDRGVKFRGDVPLAPEVVPASPGAPTAVELPDPQPVLPGSRLVPATKPPLIPDAPATQPQHDAAPQLPDPQPVNRAATPQTNPSELQVLPDPTSLRVPPPPMPRIDVPQIDSVNLFPTPQQQLENASAEVEKGWQLVLHGGVRATWDSNIFIQSKDEESDFIITFSPGLAVGIGDFRQELTTPGTFRDRFDRTDAELGKRYFFLDYNPNYHLFTGNSDESSFDQDIRAEGRYAFAKLTLGATARFETLNIADSDLGERVKMRKYHGRFGADYALTGKTTLEAIFDHTVRNYEGDRSDITEYRASAWVDYQALPKTNFALGYTHGWVDVDNGNSQEFDQFQLRMVWKASEKISIRASGGVEFRGIDNRDDVTNGTFAVGLIYNPFDATSIFLNGFRRTSTSASGQNESYTTTGFDARVVQRFSQKYFLTAAAGYQTADYEENLISGFSREDEYGWARLSLGWDVNKWMTAMIAYEYRDNDSNQDKRSFEDHLFYLQFSFLF